MISLEFGPPLGTTHLRPVAGKRLACLAACYQSLPSGTRLPAHRLVPSRKAAERRVDTFEPVSARTRRKDRRNWRGGLEYPGES